MNGVIRRPADLHRHRLLPRPEPLVLAGVGERVQLAVAVGGAVRAGQHEGVVGQLLPPPGLGDLGARAAHPDAVLGGLVGEELRRRAALGLPDARRHGEAGGERLGEQHQLGARADGPRHLRGQPLEVGVPVLPHDVVLHRGDPHASPPQPLARPRPAPRRACRRRTAPGAGPGARAPGRRTPRWGRRRRRPARAATGRTPGRRRRAAPGGRRPSRSRWPPGLITGRPASVRPCTRTSRRYSQIAGGVRRSTRRAGAARRRRPAGTGPPLT